MMKFRGDSAVKLLCTTPGGVAGTLLVMLCALFTFASVDFGASNSDIQSRSLEWLLGSEPGGIVPLTREKAVKPTSGPNRAPVSQIPENVTTSNIESPRETPAAEVDHDHVDVEAIAPTSIEESDARAPGSMTLKDLGEGDDRTGTPGDSGKLDAASITWSYDVCLLVRVGPVRSDYRPALPYSELHRLFNAARAAPNGSVGFNRKLFVGTDDRTILCKMVRDALGPGVECSNFDRFGVRKTKKCKHLVVGETTKYAQQPSLGELQKLSTIRWATMETVDLDTEDPAATPPALPESDWRPTIVTAFSSNHAEVGLLLLRSLGRVAAQQTEFNVSVVVWTMNSFLKVASRALDCVVEELRTVYNVPTEVRPFDFHAWPAWMRINQKLGYNGGRGEYAWKAVMIHTVLRETGFVYWADAGDRFKTVDGLTRTLRYAKRKGFASRLSSGQVRKWCHPMQLAYFRIANVNRIRKQPNCDASGIGFTLLKYSELARPWYECSITRQCIAPDGSSRKNHRQDQSALTVLAALTGNKCQGVDPGIRKNLDNSPKSAYTMGVDATQCYKDPLNIKWR